MAIVKMKRLRLLAMRTDREELLRRLQALGCVEVDEPEIDLADPDWSALTRPDGDGLARAREASARLTGALAILDRSAPEKKKGLPMGLTKEQIPELLKLAFSTLDRFRRKFTVNYLMVHFVAACEDPYDTAMLYGYANAAAGIVEGLSGRGWDIRRRDIQVGVDFESTECRADAEVTVTISLGRILAVLLAAGFGFIKIKRAAGKAAAAEKAERKDNDGTDADPNGGIPAGQHG